MDSWIKKLWNNNKILFFILIPLVLLIFFRDLILSILVGGARKISKEAKKDDLKLKDEQDKLNNEADEHKAVSDKLENEIKENGKDPDWHKKR